MIPKFRQYLGKGIWHYWGYQKEGIFTGPETSHGVESAMKNSTRFIGLNDKNGKEIHEGDIIRVERGRNNPYTVEWALEVCCFCLVCGKAAPMNLQDRYTKLYEVIGNIYENPELM